MTKIGKKPKPISKEIWCRVKAVRSVRQTETAYGVRGWLSYTWVIYFFTRNMSTPPCVCILRRWAVRVDARELRKCLLEASARTLKIITWRSIFHNLGLFRQHLLWLTKSLATAEDLALWCLIALKPLMNYAVSICLVVNSSNEIETFCSKRLICNVLRLFFIMHRLIRNSAGPWEF